MIKRAMYIVSVILMCVIFMLFVALESVSSSSSNEDDYIPGSNLDYSTVFSGKVTDFTSLTDLSYTAVFASIDSEIGKQAEFWCSYQKRSYISVESISDIPEALPQYIIIDSAAIDYSSDIDLLTQLHNNGAILVFSSLPDYDRIISDASLKALLGINKTYNASYKVDSVKLFEGFLIGGIYIFEDMKPEMPYFTLLPGGKVYMVGQLDAQGSLPNEELPPLIWRYSDGGTPVFVVNADFCRDETALGIYTAIISQSQSYGLYPVVNAQNMVTLNFPNVSNENSARLKAEYSMEAWQLSRDYLWQNISMIYNASGDKKVFAGAPQMSGEGDSVNNSLFPWYAEQLDKNNGELIYSAEFRGNADPAETVKTVLRRLSAMKQSYGDISAMYTASLDESELTALLDKQELSSVSALLGEYDALLGYRNNKLSLGFTYDAYVNEDEDHLRMISLFTALGYSSVEADATRLFYPESESDSWSVLGEDWSSYHVTWWKPFSDFDLLNIKNTESRVRRFLSLNYSSVRNGNTVSVDIENFENEAYFILRLSEEEITGISGGDYIQLEDGAWLVHASEGSVTIDTAQTGGAAR